MCRIEFPSIPESSKKNENIMVRLHHAIIHKMYILILLRSVQKKRNKHQQLCSISIY